MNKKQLVIINNEKIFTEDGNYFCDNLDMKVLPEGLSNYYSVNYIVRKSKKKGGQNLNLKNIMPASNIFQFISFIFKTFKLPDANYLLITITPYTFISFLILFLFGKKRRFIYLMSSGHEEWKYILGNWSVWIYNIMHVMVTSKSKVIVCNERLHDKNKSYLVSPSRLDERWLKDHKKSSLDKIRLVYVGRINPEKGIYEFLKMFDEVKSDAEFSIVGYAKNLEIKNKNVKLLGYASDPQKLINIYDDHNIMILPSFTEAHPYVLDECLSRKRPAIIFPDIAYVINGRKGVFVSERNINSFSETLKYIINNYNKIQNEMENNKLPTKKSMIKEFSNIIDNQIF
tara:strand:- start:1606 stop:2634 length:1029 start_codon:yes stop_codon:yes gene_type:complete